MMVFSLCIFANAEFKDADKISPKFADACGVMNGLGILKGDQDGVFDPQGTLTRGQAMKIITYLKLGAGADNLTATAAPFNDVKTTDWEAPFIAYCKNAKITDGYGDGNFGKDDKLSGYAFAKFLLTALGYGADPVYVGDDWKISVASDALALGLFQGIEGYLSDEALPREVAAQLAFNAAKIQPVKYVKLLETYQSAGNPFYVSPLNFNPEAVLTGVDAEGRPAKRYVAYNDSTKVIFETVAAADYTTAAGYAAAKAANKTWADIDAATPVYVNGETKSVSELESTGYVGATMEFYYGKPNADGKNTISTIIVTDYTFKTVAKVESGKVTLDGTVYSDKASLAALDGFVVGDKLAVVLKGSVVTKAVKATEVTGAKVTARNETARTFKIDGAEQKADYKLAAIPALGAFTGAYYANPNGYIIGFSGSTVEIAQTDFVYIVKIQAQKGDNDMIESKSNVVKAEAIFNDGTHKVINLTLTAGKYAKPATDGTVADTAIATLPATDIKNWFAYTEASDGSYTLAALDAKYAKLAGADVALTKGAAKQVVSLYTNSTMKLVTIDTKYNLKEQTGLVAADLKNAPTGYANTILVTYAKDAKTISAIYAVGQAPEVITVTETYARAAAKGDEVADGTEWTFFIDGKRETRVIAGTAPVVGKVYTLTKDLLKDCYTVTEKTVIANQTVEVADAAFVVAGGTTYSFAKDCEVYDVRTGHSGEAGTLAANLKIDIVEASTGVAAVIYIVG
ncbi:MAG: S-layer homology domain-containing protein [Oscillospiraceae bacterium]|nr:S-layer homology domain-containing protein [Oscillospiraceae bacterium]